MRSTIFFLFLLLTVQFPFTEVQAQTPADSMNIRNTALNYIEGWFEGDPARMAKSLHPELTKSIVVTDEETNRDMIDVMGFTKLVEGTRRGYGTSIPSEERRTNVTIFDIHGKAATVKVDAGLWVDYMHIVKFNGEWKILNVLWERK